jgi:beta-lactamase superfamily II metal-dependent hydrolase
MLIRKLLVVFSVCFQTAAFAQIKVGDAFPAWTQGYMDIHHINTGRGECVFAILPDGTSMLIDAGAVVPSRGISDARPNSSKSAGEWITRYIREMMRPLPERKIDYLFLTHFHSDHMGDVRVGRQKSKKGNYVLSGITEVGDKTPFQKIIDRDWPAYNSPKGLADDKNMQNYIRFVNWQVTNGVAAEQFKVGSNDQFKLIKQANKYPEFEIRNLAANGYVWTGVQNQVRNHFPAINTTAASELPIEHQYSAAIRISYGKFDYFNGGDLVNSNAATDGGPDIERQVGLVTGPVEVCKANNHAGYNTMGEAFLKAVRPSVVILPLWSSGQLENVGLQRMLSKSIYPEERDVFATNLTEADKKVIGRRINQMKSQQGHIVTRVHPRGDRYAIYILDDSAENYKIKAIHGPYESR